MPVNRRTLLRGAAASSIVPLSHGPVRSRSEGTELMSDGSGVSVRIVDADDPVPGAGRLEWTAELENATDRSVRPTVEYLVDGEPVGNVTLTLGPGETERPFPRSYRVEPTARDREVTVQVRAAGDSAERAITVLGVDELDEDAVRPNGELAVQPGTTVLFEVDAVDPDTSQSTGWWANGDPVSDSQTAVPWQSVYYAAQNAHYWQYTAESTGTDEITAGVETDSGNYRAEWTVTVTPDGHASPTIQDTRPATGPLPVGREEETDLEIDVTDPDGELERVVWWLGQSDRILGTSDVNGATDTASLSIDGGCHTCPIIAWVIAADGTFTAESLWEIGETASGDDAELDVSITATNDPVDAGDVLEVTATLENTNDRAVSGDVELVVGHDPTTVDTHHVSIDGKTTETIVLEFETAMVANDQSFPVEVVTDGSVARRTVRVRGAE